MGSGCHLLPQGYALSGSLTESPLQRLTVCVKSNINIELSMNNVYI